MPGSTEKKFYDLNTTSTSVANTGVILNSGTLNNIAQGVTESTRVGRKCTIVGIHWRYTTVLQNSTGSVNTLDNLRMVLYMDKQCNGATAAVTDILETATRLSFNNLANKDRFRILADRNVDIAATAGNGTANCRLSKSGSLHLKCAIPIEFSSTTGAITEIRSNNLGILLISENGDCDFHSAIRLRFSDS